jgi:TrmH family RNA methyltransferase
MLTMPCISARSVECRGAVGKPAAARLARERRDVRRRALPISSAVHSREREPVQIPVRIVLVETSHPGNIGAAARAMHTMGVTELVLVRPRAPFPSADATARAAGADEILANARVVSSVPEAIADCGFVAGASARLRTIAVPIADPRECAAELWRRVPASRAALLFGNEQSGLTNEDLARCQQLVHIPTNPDYSSLNLAMSVQVLCYELRMSAAQRPPREAPAPESPPATAAELEGLHEHLERLLTESGFLHPEHQRQVKLKLRRIFQRAALDQNELSILRGMLSSLGPAKRYSKQPS